MTEKQFIEFAIEGGWYFGNWSRPIKIGKIEKSRPAISENGLDDWMVEYNEKNEMVDDKLWYRRTYFQFPILDPKAWKAVGNVKGWKSLHVFKEPGHVEVMEWMMYMHNMIDCIIDNRDYQEFLEIL